MESVESFMKRYKALDHSESFKTVMEDSLENEGEEDGKRDDEKFKEGTRLFAKWAKKTYVSAKV